MVELGPLFLTFKVYSTVDPTLGLIRSTVLIISISEACGVELASALLLDRSNSGVLLDFIVTIFFNGIVLRFNWILYVITPFWPSAKVERLSVFLSKDNVPIEVVASRIVYPSGIKSVITTSSATEGPALTYWTLKLITAPACGLSLSTNFVIWRSVYTGSFLSVSSLFLRFWSKVSELTLTLLIVGVNDFIITLIVSVWVSPTPISPIVQIDLFHVPLLAWSDTYSIPAGRVSLTLVFFAIEGPSFRILIE